MRDPRLLVVITALVGAAAHPGPSVAQDFLPPWEGGLTTSLGQPPHSRFYAIGGTGVDWRKPGAANPIVLGGLGVSRSLFNPIMGALAASLEGYAGLRATSLDGGVRGLLVSSSIRLTGGVDYNIAAGRLSPILAYSMPVRRGGVFSGGSLLRVELNLGAADAVRVSVMAPLRQPAAGRTRPRQEAIAVSPRQPERLSSPADAPGLQAALTTVRHAAERIQDLVVPPIDDPAADPRQALAPVVKRLLQPPALPGVVPDGSLGVEATVRAYHAELVRAFSIAVSGEPVAEGGATVAGTAVTGMARQALLEHVIYPYNRMLGRRKDRNTITSLSGYARGSFARALVSAGQLSPERQAAAQYAFQELLFIVTTVEAEALRTWQDSRVLWIPLQLALLPEDHDTQAELDRIIEDAVETRFTDGNQIWYVINEQFRVELDSTIRNARDYHVLWIHDFRGRNSAGDPDALSFRYAVESYLGALTDRVREYDRTRRLPAYMIFLDQHYYEANRGHLWLDFLERPLGPVPRMPRGFEEFERRLHVAQDSLRAAMEHSQLLEAERRQYGDQWVRNLVKIHVSITNPVDPSFWGRDIMPIIGIPDDFMRDHRKIVFYDITEDDPYRGMAIYTGMGIGEHYAGPTWEDRSIMAQGPAVLSLKAQARQLLLTQGFSGEQIPVPLRPRPMPASYDSVVRARIDSLRQTDKLDFRAMELHNGTGFLDKPINVARATLYSLMPRGAVVKVPDSLWGSAIYASLLVGSAFRGVRVLFIAPSLVSAPSSGWPAMGIAHDLFARLIVLQQDLGPELEAGGGMLKTGIYNPGIGVQRIDLRLAAAYRNGRLTPFLRRLFPVSPMVDSMLVQLGRGLQMAEVAGTLTGEAPVSPKLHLKANFFASREAWDSLVARPEMVDVLLAYGQQFVGRDDGTWPGAREAADALGDAGQRLWESYRRMLSPSDSTKVLFYLLVGSANQDYRSMFMDGEASVLLSGWSSVMSLVDFGLLVNLSVWVDDLTLLDALLPPPSGFQRKAARWLRSMM
jgi:hypothetical protein